jgi:hypothetical protein
MAIGAPRVWPLTASTPQFSTILGEHNLELKIPGVSSDEEQASISATKVRKAPHLAAIALGLKQMQTDLDKELDILQKKKCPLEKAPSTGKATILVSSTWEGNSKNSTTAAKILLDINTSTQSRAPWLTKASAESSTLPWAKDVQMNDDCMALYCSLMIMNTDPDLQQSPTTALPLPVVSTIH